MRESVRRPEIPQKLVNFYACFRTLLDVFDV